ncbi:MAG: SLBB domain-containing protein [Acidobacteriota bacterium]
MSRKERRYFPILVVSLWACLLHAQHPNWNQRLNELSLPSEEDSEYRIGSGDLLELLVFGVEDFHHLLRVSGSGSIAVPLLGTIAVAGLTAAELAVNVGAALERKELIRNAQVSVLIREYRSHPVFILGMVNQPGQYQMTRPLRLVDVIAMAGGIREDRAAEDVTVQRKVAGTSGSGQSSPQPERLRVSLKELLENGNPSVNLLIRKGDVIRIPPREAKLFYVIGDVNRPGAYELSRGRETLLTQALAQAGGPTKTAKTSKSVLLRYGDGDRRERLRLNIKAILGGKKPDFAMRSDDVIFVPGSTSKDILYAMLGALPRTLSRAIVVP